VEFPPTTEQGTGESRKTSAIVECIAAKEEAPVGTESGLTGATRRSEFFSSHYIRRLVHCENSTLRGNNDVVNSNIRVDVYLHQDILDLQMTSMSVIIRARTGFTNKLFKKAEASPDGKLTSKWFAEGPYGGMHMMHSFLSSCAIFIRYVHMGLQSELIKSMC
jgi:hypothetical protein